jgi:ubiquinone/menaquinone biosynthesis C-methylase UbiE
MSDDPVSAYDAIADEYAETNPSVDARATYEWPMVERLLPSVDGLRVLDAGVGSGHFAATLADRGATVVGVDASPRMLRAARARHGDAIALCRANVRAPLPFAADRFDLVVCQLTLEHVRDWDALLGEFARVLVDDGRLVASTDHPFSTYVVIEHEPPAVGAAAAETADYYGVERYVRDWSDDTDDRRVPFYRRPLREVVRPLFDAGFVLEDLLEPAPDADEGPLAYFDDELPRFIGLRARLD